MTGPVVESGEDEDDEHPPRHSRPLLEIYASMDPFQLFGEWYEEARAVVRVPESVALATVGPTGQPSIRMVLCKGWDERGYVFHTNYGSRKGVELAGNPLSALLFYWDPLGRQVRIEGRTTRVSPQESDDYFLTRPFGAQVGAWASKQSSFVESRELLDERIAQLASELAGRPPTRPEWWGGYRIEPETFEFWQNRDDRLHDRLHYRRSADGWIRQRLQP